LRTAANDADADKLPMTTEKVPLMVELTVPWFQRRSETDELDNWPIDPVPTEPYLADAVVLLM
jgi:hypothetical protein